VHDLKTFTFFYNPANPILTPFQLSLNSNSTQSEIPLNLNLNSTQFKLKFNSNSTQSEIQPNLNSNSTQFKFNSISTLFQLTFNSISALTPSTETHSLCVFDYCLQEPLWQCEKECLSDMYTMPELRPEELENIWADKMSCGDPCGCN